MIIGPLILRSLSVVWLAFLVKPAFSSLIGDAAHDREPEAPWTPLRTDSDLAYGYSHSVVFNEPPPSFSIPDPRSTFDIGRIFYEHAHSLASKACDIGQGISSRLAVIAPDREFTILGWLFQSDGQCAFNQAPQIQVAPPPTLTIPTTPTGTPAPPAPGHVWKTGFFFAPFVHVAKNRPEPPAPQYPGYLTLCFTKTISCSQGVFLSTFVFIFVTSTLVITFGVMVRFHFSNNRGATCEVRDTLNGRPAPSSQLFQPPSLVPATAIRIGSIPNHLLIGLLPSAEQPTPGMLASNAPWYARLIEWAPHVAGAPNEKSPLVRARPQYIVRPGHMVYLSPRLQSSLTEEGRAERVRGKKEVLERLEREMASVESEADLPKGGFTKTRQRKRGGRRVRELAARLEALAQAASNYVPGAETEATRQGGGE